MTELGEQAGLADAGLTLDRHAGRRPAREHAQHRIELCELGVASDERPGEGVGAHPGASLTLIGSGFRDPRLHVAGNGPPGSIGSADSPDRARTTGPTDGSGHPCRQLARTTVYPARLVWPVG